MSRESWTTSLRNVALGIVATIALTAAGSAVAVRDRVGLVEARQDKAEAVQLERDKEVLRRLDDIQATLKEHHP